MKKQTCITRYACSALIASFGVLLLTSCQSSRKEAGASAPKPAASALSASAQAQPAPAIIRIRAGESTPLTDSNGNVWLADQGFADGQTISRAGDLEIANTKDPALYRSERYSMTSFSRPLPNGKYTVKLHFCETFEGITGPGQRVFSFIVEGRQFKDFDVWVKAGGPQRAYIESVPVDISDGKLDIQFIPNIENPEINGIEIIPGP
jgi:hypothetical protein